MYLNTLKTLMNNNFTVLHGNNSLTVNCDKFTLRCNRASRINHFSYFTACIMNLSR